MSDEPPEAQDPEPMSAAFSLGIYMFWWFTTRCRSRTSTSLATGLRRKSW
jgi:hypothetical protein